MIQFDQVGFTDLSRGEENDFNAHYYYKDSSRQYWGGIESFIYSLNCNLHGDKLRYFFKYVQEKSLG